MVQFFHKTLAVINFMHCDKNFKLSDAGFVDPFSPCCTGGNTQNTVWNCGVVDDDGKPMYHVCKDPSKSVIFDFIHPSQAAWKTIVHLYSSVPGFTHFGPKLNTWMKQNHI
jgi:hypothetical protein